MPDAVDEVPFAPYLRAMILAECKKHYVRILRLNAARQKPDRWLAIVVICEDVTRTSAICKSTVALTTSNEIRANVPDGDEVIQGLELAAKAGRIPVFAILSDGQDERRSPIGLGTQEIAEA